MNKVSIGGKVSEELKEKFEATAKAMGLTNTELMNICFMSSFNVLEDGILQDKDKEVISQIINEAITSNINLPANVPTEVEEPTPTLTKEEQYEEMKLVVFGQLPQMLKNEYLNLINLAFEDCDEDTKTWEQFETLADLLAETAEEPTERNNVSNFDFEKCTDVDTCLELLTITQDAVKELGDGQFKKDEFYMIVSRWLHESVKVRFEMENMIMHSFTRYEHSLLLRLMEMENRSRSEGSKIDNLSDYMIYLVGKEAKRKADNIFSPNKALKELGNKLIAEATE